MCICHIYQSHHTTVFQKEKQLTNFVENIIHQYLNFALFLLLFCFLYVCLFKQNKPTYKKKKKEKEQNLDKECSQKICASDHEVKEEETKKDI